MKARARRGLEYAGRVHITGLDHLVLTVADIEATVNFYERLGMQRETFGDGRVALRFGHRKINLHREGAEFAPHAARPTPGSADVCLLVAEPIEGVAAELLRAGVEIELGTRTGARSELCALSVQVDLLRVGSGEASSPTNVPPAVRSRSRATPSQSGRIPTHESKR